VQFFELFRDCREFGLRDQILRSAVSIPSNIAEGYERTNKDFLRFLSIANGSAAELRTQTYIAGKIGLFEPEKLAPIVHELKEISKMIIGLARSIRARLKKQNPEL
jgi:four helix bundle protein